MTDDEVRSRTGQLFLSDTVTLFYDVACLSSDPSVMPASQSRPELFSRAFWVLPKTGVAETILAEDSGGRSMSAQFRPGDGKAARFGQIGMAATRGDGYI